MNTVLLLLADSRFPAGGHAHSSGVEAAVASGRVTDVSTLESFLVGRLHTTGLVAAAFAASACKESAAVSGAAGEGSVAVSGAAGEGSVGGLGTAGEGSAAVSGAAGEGSVAVLDAELDARTPSPAQRLASRRQGKALMRAARAIWAIDGVPADPHLPIALGITAAAAGLSEVETAHLAVFHQVSGQASAALRLLGLNPYDIQACLARLAPQCDAVAAQAAAFAGKDPAELPMLSSPIADISAELHATWEVRLFAS
jgi:urease accessory protein